MDSNGTPTLADQLAAAQDWWREAGVDYVFSDEVTPWAQEVPEGEAEPATAAPAPVAKAPAEPSKPAIGGDPANWPQDLAAFREWWLTEPSLDAGGASPRIAPRGAAGAKLMVLVAEPEAQDSETLLSGPQGRLLASFFGAAGLDEADAYVAAVLPRHTPFPDWAGLAQQGLGEIVRHHVRLVAPERLLLLGQPILPLTGHNPTKIPAILREFNHQDGSVSAIAARSLDHMLRKPASRSRFWCEWLDWTD